MSEEKDKDVEKKLAEFKQMMKERFLKVEPQGVLISPKILQGVGINVGDLVGIYDFGNDQIGISRIDDLDIVKLERQGEESIKNMVKGAVEETDVVDRIIKGGQHIRVHIQIPKNIKEDLEAEERFRVIEEDKEK